MLAVSASPLGVGSSLARVVDSISGVDRKPTPFLLLPVDGRVATALRPDIEESWNLSSKPAETRRGAGGQPVATATRRVDDTSYRFKRARNNEAARRSREKRRRQDDVVRHQLEALAAENRDLRCQLALLRRLLDDVAGGTLASQYHKAGVVLQPGSSLSSVCSSGALSTSSDQSHGDDVVDESSVDDVGVELQPRDGEHVNSAETVDCQQQLLTPLNLSQRVASS